MLAFIVTPKSFSFTVLLRTSQVPVEGKSSVCLICMKYRIIILIIIISLGQILLWYIENTSRTHARTQIHTHTHSDTHTAAEPFRLAMGRWRSTVMARSAGDNGRRCFIQIKHARAIRFPEVLCFFRV